MGEKYDGDRLASAVAQSVNWSDLMRRLGLTASCGQRRVLQAKVNELGLDTGHFRNRRLDIDAKALRAAVSTSASYADVMRVLGLAVNDTNHRRVRRVDAQLSLDTSHFRRRAWGTVRVPEPRRPVAPNVLVVSPEGSPRVNRARLHRALQEIDVPYACARCGNTGEWLGESITLPIDHISGDWLDNRRENLRYLRPNCHALTDTWCRNRHGGARPSP